MVFKASLSASSDSALPSSTHARIARTAATKGDATAPVPLASASPSASPASSSASSASSVSSASAAVAAAPCSADRRPGLC